MNHPWTPPATSVLLLCYFCATSALLPFYFCSTSVLLLCCFRSTSTLLPCYFRATSELLPCSFSAPSVRPAPVLPTSVRATSVLPLLPSCFLAAPCCPPQDLWLGELAALRDGELLEEAGITAAVDCTSNVKLQGPPHLRVYHRLVIHHELKVKAPGEFAEEIAALADIADKHHTIIFCERGRHRSATTCAALIMLLTGQGLGVAVFGPRALVCGSVWLFFLLRLRGTGRALSHCLQSLPTPCSRSMLS